MPIDASIPLQARPTPIEDPTTEYAKILGLQQSVNQSRLANLQIRNMETQLDQQQKLRQLFAGGMPTDAQGNIDYGALAPKMAAITGDPTAAVKLQGAATDLALKRTQITGEQYANTSKAMGIGAQMVQGVLDQPTPEAQQAAWERVLNQGVAMNDPILSPGFKQLAAQHPQFDPAVAQQVVNQSLNVKDHADIQLRAASEAETARHNRADESTAGGRLALERFKSAPQYIEQEEAAKTRGQMGAFGAPAGAAGPPVSGDDFLKTLDPTMASQVKALAEGRMQIPSGFALKSPYWQNLIRALGQYDPNFDMVNYQARTNTRKDFTSGKSADNVTAINTAVAHLGSLADAFDALKNGDYPAYNKVANALGQQLGNPDLQKEFADVSTRSEAVAHELAKVFRNSGMSEAEVNAWKQRVDPNAPPGSQKGVIGSALDLMHGRLMALTDRYNTGMGTTKDPMDLLTPEAQQTFQRLEQYASGTKGAPAPGSAQPGAGRGASGGFGAPPALPKVNAQGWQLHQDAHGNFAYVSPDGKQVQEVKP